MEFCGIITEFNPLTNGHFYFISEAARKSGLPVISVMSGNFTQRGEPAILNKFTRAELAIKAGCFACFELPTVFSVAPAEQFALGAVRALNSLGVTKLAFGCEHDNLNDIITIANFLSSPKKEFTHALKQRLSKGENHHFATAKLLEEFLPDVDIKKIFSGANNILAIEYIKAINKINPQITPILIRRVDNGFTSNSPRAQYLGASNIRERFLKGENISAFVPSLTEKALHSEQFNYPAFLLHQLYTIRSTPAEKLKLLFDYAEGIENLILKNSTTALTMPEAITACVTKRYREARIKRLCIYPLIGLTKSIAKEIASCPVTLKLLAIKKVDKNKIAEFRKRDARIVVTSADYTLFASPSLTLDILASNLYNAYANLPHNFDLTHGTSFID